MKSSRIARLTLLALFWANFLNFYDRQVIAALAPILKVHWHLSDTQVGLLATAFEVAYALAPVPIAILADRWLRRRVVALALATWSGAMALLGSAASYSMLLLGRAALGLGEAGYGPSALAWISDLFAPDHRSRAVSIHDTALMLGSAAGYALGGVLGNALGWRPVFYLAALPGLLLAALIWYLPEPARGESDYRALGMQPGGGAAASIPWRQAMQELMAIPTLLVTYAMGVLVNIATSGLIYWLPSFAVRYHGLGEGQAGLVIGVFTVVAGTAGVLCGGMVADRLFRRTMSARLITVGASFALGFPLAVLALFVPGSTPFFVLAAAAVFLFTFYFPCLAPLIHQVTRPELRATAMGLGLFFVHILGNAPGPALVGWLSDQTGDLRIGLAASLVAALLAALVAFWGTRFVRRDTVRVVERLRAGRTEVAG
jgi:predicted MFS family arabinose efflux permease